MVSIWLNKVSFIFDDFKCRFQTETSGNGKNYQIFWQNDKAIVCFALLPHCSTQQTRINASTNKRVATQLTSVSAGIGICN